MGKCSRDGQGDPLKHLLPQMSHGNLTVANLESLGRMGEIGFMLKLTALKIAFFLGSVSLL